MRPAPLAAVLAAAVSSVALAALAPAGGVRQFTDVPARAHRALGPVAALARPGPDGAPAVSLAEAARARYGDVDALARVRAVALPFADGALVTGVAVRWD